MTTRSALISGAGISGLATAFWLAEARWDVTVVERAPRLRTTGYPVDIRGAAVEVVHRMGLYDQISARRYQDVPIAVVSQDGRRAGTIELRKGADDVNVEILRGDLGEILYQASRERAGYVFGDSITSLTQRDTDVAVTFRHRRSQTFDVVIGADGLHSGVRRLTFGDESQFVRHLGPYVAVWDVHDAELVEAGAGVMYWHPGRSVMIERPADGSAATAFLTFGHPDPGTVNRHDTDEVLGAVRGLFAEERGGDIISTLPDAQDLYFDTVSQVRMSRWSSGRVALVGDSAYAPTFRSGRATSVAITGAYVLASELARTCRPEEAFAAYESRLRGYVDRNQDAAAPTCGSRRSQPGLSTAQPKGPKTPRDCQPLHRADLRRLPRC